MMQPGNGQGAKDHLELGPKEGVELDLGRAERAQALEQRNLDSDPDFVNCQLHTQYTGELLFTQLQNRNIDIKNILMRI